MKITRKLYYLAAVLALAAAAINIYVDGLGPDHFIYVGFLILMSVIMLWLGSRQTTNPLE